MKLILKHALLIVSVLYIGCATSPAPERSTVLLQREEWARQRAYEIGEPLGVAFDSYCKVSGSPRGGEFEVLGMMIMFTQPLVSGRESLDLLGTPDLWKSEGDSADFVYFFTGANRKRSILHVEISRDGKTIKALGWNSVGVKDYRALGYHS